MARPRIGCIHQHDRVGLLEPVRRRGTPPTAAPAPDQRAQQPEDPDAQDGDHHLVGLGDPHRDRQRQRAPQHRDRHRDHEQTEKALGIDPAQERSQRDHRQGAGQHPQDRRQPREQFAQDDLGVGEVGSPAVQEFPAGRDRPRPAVAAGATRSTIASWMPAMARKEPARRLPPASRASPPGPAGCRPGGGGGPVAIPRPSPIPDRQNEQRAPRTPDDAVADQRLVHKHRSWPDPPRHRPAPRPTSVIATPPRPAQPGDSIGILDFSGGGRPG